MFCLGICLHSNPMELLSLRTKDFSFSEQAYISKSQRRHKRQSRGFAGLNFFQPLCIFMIHLPNKIKDQNKTKTKLTLAFSSIFRFNYSLFVFGKYGPEYCSIVTFDVLPSGGLCG